MILLNPVNTKGIRICFGLRGRF